MYKCIVVDDDPLAINVLKTYIEKIGFLDLVDTFTNPLLALSFLEKTQIDLILIDIQMPGITGIELINKFDKKGKFIITSAYREYAYDGFELDVLDFIGKPISFERFLKAVSKLINKSTESTEDSQSARFIFIKENKRMTKVLFEDLLFLESKRDFIKLVCETNIYTTRGTISYYEEWLPKREFVRVHRSFIVAINKILHFSDEIIELINGKKIPIGDLYSKTFKELMQKHLL
jgi:DNA-binding LytR/AlgR family response regulator